MKPLAMFSPITVAAVLAACSSSRSHETTASTAQAIAGGALDDRETPAIADVVVQVQGDNGVLCSGVFISPIAVLTAAHCMCNGDPSFSIVGGYSPGPSSALSYRASRDNAKVLAPCPYSMGNDGEDLAILFLDPGQTPVLESPAVHRPTLGAPCAAGSSCPDASGGNYNPLLGLAGYAPTDGTNTWRNAVRQVAYVSNMDHSPGDPFDFGQYWRRAEDSVHIDHGDSGGPIFVERLDASGNVFRDVLGIASTMHWDPGYLAMVDTWTDITRGEIRDWVSASMSDNSRTPDWNARHPAGPSRGGYWWIGEVDYVGPCLPAFDSDCDHWTNLHDDCTQVFNPDQTEAITPGIGDACNQPNTSPPPQGCQASVVGCNDEVEITCPSSSLPTVLQLAGAQGAASQDFVSVAAHVGNSGAPIEYVDYPLNHILGTPTSVSYRVCISSETSQQLACGDVMTLALPNDPCPSGSSGGTPPPRRPGGCGISCQ
jgi:hypothetical protein